MSTLSGGAAPRKTYRVAKAAFMVFLALMGLSLISQWQRAKSRQSESAPESTSHNIARPIKSPGQRDEARALQVLRHGTGEDWLRLSDREKTLVCLAADRTLDQDGLAWSAYKRHLDGFYARGNERIRSHPIRETIAFCQGLIDRGTLPGWIDRGTIAVDED